MLNRDLLTFNIPNVIHIPCPTSFQGIRPSQKPVFLRWEVVSSSPNAQAGEPPLVCCLLLNIRNIRNYPPYLEAFSSIHNPSMRHAVVAGIHTTMRRSVRIVHICICICEWHCLRLMCHWLTRVNSALSFLCSVWTNLNLCGFFVLHESAVKSN